MGNEREARQQELARLMLRKAQQDLDALTALRDNRKIADEIVGFHAQQTIEKALKATLTRLGIQYDFTHDLAALFEQVEEAGVKPPASLTEVEELTAFAVQFRYALYDEDEGLDRQAKTGLAEKFIGWAQDVIEKPLGNEAIE